MTHRTQLLIAGAICGAVIAGSAIYMGTRPHWETVGTISTTMECGWDADSTTYQNHIIYRDSQGRRIGQSAGAGECNNHP